MALLPQHRSSKTLSDQKPILPPSRTRSWEHLSYEKETIGYAKVAEFIATDKELAIYRRFDRTAARILLALQSEILSKQNQLDNLDAEDARDPDEKVQKVARTIDGEFAGPRSAREEEKLRLCKELRGLLKDYCKSSMQFSLPQPEHNVSLR